MVLVLASNLTVLAAWPRISMVYGDGLPSPIFLSDSEENSALMSAATEADVSKDELAGRPYFHLALFSGNEWDGYAHSCQPGKEVSSRPSNQCGPDYTATAQAHAVLTSERIPV